MRQSATVFLLIFNLSLILQISHQRSNKSSLTYTAAVVEYSPPLGITLKTVKEHVNHNVEAYSEFAKRAAEMDADIIVFPECGLVSIQLPRNPDGSPAYAVEIPLSSDINPCLDKSSDLAEELKKLSCIARDNSIYLVINIPERDKCPSGGSSSCFESGVIYYNTNVVFDREGNIIARYRKTHLFGERGFSPSSTADPVVFETDFGVKFGTFICFDLMFEYPALQLVRDMGVTDIIFPTAWFSELPFFTAVQAQEAWAHANDVNFLASGYNYPQVGSGGSGIYNGRNGHIVATMPPFKGSHLLVASVPKRSTKTQNEFVPKSSIIPFNTIIQDNPKFLMNSGRKASENYVSNKDTPNEKICPEKKSFNTHENLEHSCAEEAYNFLLGEEIVVNGTGNGQSNGIFLMKEEIDNYTTMMFSTENLFKGDHNVQLCHGVFCCNFKISAETSSITGVMKTKTVERAHYFYRLAVYDGRRGFSVVDGAIQVCAIITCTSEEFDSCGRLSTDTHVKQIDLHNIEISGTFQSKHSLPTPNTLLDGNLMPLPVTSYEYIIEDVSESAVNVTMKSNGRLSFLTFGVYSRNFVKD